MAISLRAALSISDARLPRQSVVAFNFRVRSLCQIVSAYRPDCLFQTVTGFGRSPQFEFDTQVVLYKDAESKVTKKIYDFWAPYHL